MVGIYKIESPTGTIYIGQSRNIEKRFSLYRYIKRIKRQPTIERSILKHGHENHIFSVVCELPKDIDNDTLTRYEQIYMDQYRECGFDMMNILAARGSIYGFKRPEEQKKKHSEFMKGRPSPMKGVKLTQEQKDHLSKINTGKPFSEVARQKLKGRSVWNKGLKGSTKGAKGYKHSEETKEKLRLIGMGKKLSPETIQKRTATLKINGVKRRWTKEAKERRSKQLKGKNKSLETIEKGRATRLLNKNNNAIQK